MRFQDAVDAYIADSGRLRTASSRQTFRKVLNHLQKFADGQERLDRYDQQTLTDWCLSGGAAPNTVKKRRAHARSFFGWCTYKGWLQHDPSSGLVYSVVPGRGGGRNHTWLSKAELVEVIRACPDTQAGERDRLIIMFGSLCGLRAEELCGLRWKDFSPDWSTLTLIGKGQKPATIGVPSELRDALKRWHTHRPAGASVVLPRMRQMYFSGTRARVCDWTHPLEYHGVLYAVQSAGKRAGWKLDPHDLRRSFAGILEESGVAVTDISRAMRHNDVGTTSRYLEKNPRRTVEVTEGLTLGL